MISISEELKIALPFVKLIGFQGDVKVEEQNDELWTEIDRKIEERKNQLKIEDISGLPNNFTTREAYKRLGKDPSRYRPSAEALLRRIVSGKGLYRVNNVVDVLNLLSVSTGFSIGGYDLEKIQGNVLLARGHSSDPYEAIGRGTLNIENLPALKDEAGCFGTPTSDSLRTSVTSFTRHFLMVFFCFNENFTDEKNLEAQVESYLKKYTFSTSVSSFIAG